MTNFPLFTPPTLGHLAPNQIHIWQFALKDFLAFEKILSDLFVDDELASYQRAKKHQAYPAQLASRAFLRILLAPYLDIEAQNIILTKNEYGKPELLNQPWLKLSLSHTKEQIVFALTRDQRLGIDLEENRHLTDFLDLAARFFSKAEYQSLLSLPEDKAKTQFMRLWTLKEAFVKAVGFGLSYPLADFSMIIDQENAYIAEKKQEKEPSLASDWQCYVWDLKTNQHLALVSEGKQKTICYQQAHPEAFIKIY